MSRPRFTKLSYPDFKERKRLRKLRNDIKALLEDMTDQEALEWLETYAASKLDLARIIVGQV